METKRKAFTSGKSCVFQIFNESQFFECDRDAVELIHKNYDLIVDYLTTDSSKKLCQGVNPLYQKLQCEVIKDKWLIMDSELINSGNNTQEEIDGFLELGNVLKVSYQFSKYIRFNYSRNACHIRVSTLKRKKVMWIIDRKKPYFVRVRS